MNEGESKQLTEVSNDIKWIIKEMKDLRLDFKEDISHVIESQNGKNLAIDNRITDACGKIESIKTEQNTMKVENAVGLTKLTAIIGVITFVLTMVAQAIFTTVTEMLKK